MSMVSADCFAWLEEIGTLSGLLNILSMVWKKKKPAVLTSMISVVKKLMHGIEIDL